VTTQIPDTFLLCGEGYSIAGVSGERLFRPESYGLHPAGYITACWRNYLARYTLKSNELVLDELKVNLHDARQPATIDVEPPEVNGVAAWKPKGPWYIERLYPNLMERFWAGADNVRSELDRKLGIDPYDPHTIGEHLCVFDYVYEDLGLKLRFTGDILLARGLFRELDDPLELRSPWKYETVLELRFRRGRFVKKRDLSDRMRESREREIEQGYLERLRAREAKLIEDLRQLSLRSRREDA
jgi:hypothetical protein